MLIYVSPFALMQKRPSHYCEMLTTFLYPKFNFKSDLRLHVFACRTVFLLVSVVFFSVCMRPCVSICPSIRLSVRPSVRRFVLPFVWASAYSSIRLSVCPSIRPSVCLFVCLSVRLAVGIWFYLLTCLLCWYDYKPHSLYTSSVGNRSFRLQVLSPTWRSFRLHDQSRFAYTVWVDSPTLKSIRLH